LEAGPWNRYLASLLGDERVGRPKSTRTELDIAAVADFVKNNGQIA